MHLGLRFDEIANVKADHIPAGDLDRSLTTEKTIKPQPSKNFTICRSGTPGAPNREATTVHYSAIQQKQYAQNCLTEAGS